MCVLEFLNFEHLCSFLKELMQKLTNSTIYCASKGLLDPPWLTMSSPTGAQASPGLSTMKIVFSGRVWKYSPSSTCHRGWHYWHYIWNNSSLLTWVPSLSSTIRTGSPTLTHNFSRPEQQETLTTCIHRVSQKLFTLCHLKYVFKLW